MYVRMICSIYAWCMNVCIQVYTYGLMHLCMLYVSIHTCMSVCINICMSIMCVCCIMKRMQVFMRIFCMYEQCIMYVFMLVCFYVVCIYSVCKQVCMIVLLHMSMCVMCKYVYECVCICACRYICLCMKTFLCMCIGMCIYECMDLCACRHVCLCMHEYKYVQYVCVKVLCLPMY